MTSSTPKVAAAAFRSQHGLGTAPVRDLRGIVEDFPGVDLAVLKMPSWIDGMTVKDPDTGVALLAVSTSDVPERQRFTIAHELGHLVLEELSQGVPDHTRSPMEMRMDGFARHFLIPEEGLVQALRSRGRTRLRLEVEDLSEVVREFGVSPMTACIQLLSIRWITSETKNAWASWTAPRLATRFGWANEREADVLAARTEQPFRRIVANATEAYLSGRLPLAAVARARGTDDIDGLEREFQEAGLYPVPDEQAGTGFADIDALLGDGA